MQERPAHSGALWAGPVQVQSPPILRYECQREPRRAIAIFVDLERPAQNKEGALGSFKQQSLLNLATQKELWKVKATKLVL